jgi:SAM-dependent methyltransferase
VRWAWSNDWREFFGEGPYPYDLSLVEMRDGWERECRMVRTVVGPPPCMLIDLGCGYGRHMAGLREAGYRVVGTDISVECVRRSLERPDSHQAVCAANEYLPFPDKVFDGAYSVYSSIGYAGTCTLRILAEACRVTRPGGWLVIDVSRDPARSLRWGWERVPHGVAAWTKRTGKRWVHQRNFVASRRVMGQFGFTMERHTAVSLQRGAQRAGWAECQFYGDHALSPLEAVSRRLVMVACRPS